MKKIKKSTIHYHLTSSNSEFCANKYKLRTMYVYFILELYR